MPEESVETTISEKLYSLILSNDIDGIHGMYQDKEFTASIGEHSWGILDKLTSMLSEELDDDQINCLNSVLTFLVEHGKPKEMLFGLLEYCQAFEASEMFMLVLPHLKKVVCDIGVDVDSLKIVLETLFSHVKGMNWNREDYKLVVPEECSSPYEACRVTIDDLLIMISSILKDFLHPLLLTSLPMAETHKSCIGGFIINLFHYPLLYLYTDNDLVLNCSKSLLSALKSVYPTISQILIGYLTETNAKVVYKCNLMRNQPLSDALVEESRTLGLGNVAHLILSKGLHLDSLPHVYSNQYLLSLLLPCVNALALQATNGIVADKLLSLIRRIFSRFDSEELDDSFVELEQFLSLISYCHWSMQFAELLPHRKASTQCLDQIMIKLSPKSKFVVFNYILHSQTSADVLGYTFTQIKDYIHQCWGEADKPDIERRCTTLLSKVFMKPPDDQQHGDLIADLNKISSALNIALYLTLRDTRRISNLTKHMTQYLNTYIKPIGKCLADERSNLTSRISEIKDLLDHGSTNEEEGVTIQAGTEMITCSPELELEVINTNIAKLDLVIHTFDYLMDVLSN